MFLAIAAGAILWDHFDRHSAYVTTDDAPLSFLDPGLWPWWIAGLFVLMALEALLAVVVYRDGPLDVRLAVVNAVLASPSPVPALWLLAERAAAEPRVLPDARPRRLARRSHTIVGDRRRIRHRRDRAVGHRRRAPQGSALAR